MPKLIYALLCVAVIAGSQGCAHVKEESFYVTDASLQENARHRELSKTFVSKRTRLDDQEFVVTGHRITADGKGTVIGLRSFAPGSAFLVDQAGFQKISVYLPGTSLTKGAEVQIPGQNGAMAYYSSGLSNLPGGGGCFGYATTGSIKVIDVSPSDVTISADLLFGLSGPAGAALSDCDDKRIRGTYVARHLRVQELTPWQGTMGKNIYEETIAR